MADCAAAVFSFLICMCCVWPCLLQVLLGTRVG